MNPSEMQHAFDEFTLDAGITYLDNKVRRYSHLHALYTEEYVVLTRQSSSLLGDSMSWMDLRRLPLCLLTPEMQSCGSILAQIFEDSCVDAPPHIETNSIATLEAYVDSGDWAGVAPASMLAATRQTGDLRAIPLPPLPEPAVVGVAIPHRDPASLLAAAFFDAAVSPRAAAAVDKLLRPGHPTLPHRPLREIAAARA
jgi:DNA-binding transcriptional LysR family regulator